MFNDRVFMICKARTFSVRVYFWLISQLKTGTPSALDKSRVGLYDSGLLAECSTRI